MGKSGGKNALPSLGRKRIFAKPVSFKVDFNLCFLSQANQIFLYSGNLLTMM
jgi:hypothetical protein